ncbi:hypothetical protein [Nostoc sp. ChiQUE01b]|nr:hypothetical protein [Nostoc sp. ChiQUE01b]MDZ8260722.1 hypothetical protein [Nostoc sp. ChiQUE01b]
MRLFVYQVQPEAGNEVLKKFQLKLTPMVGRLTDPTTNNCDFLAYADNGS